MKAKKLIFAMILCLLTVSISYGQKSTEMFIPLGQSPGLSGKTTFIGTIETFNAQDSTLTIITDKGSKTFKIKGQPKVWLDYSKQQLPNKKGAYSEFKPGIRVELKFVNHETADLIEWIKVEMKSSN